MWLLILASVAIATILYKLFFSSSDDFFKKHGIPQIDTTPAAGKFDTILGKKPSWVADDYAYTKMDKFCGILELGKPVILVKDVNLIKKILIKDFDHFLNRRKLFTEKDGSFNLVLFSLQGEKWKGVRSSVSPTFTTGKIRRIMEYFNIVGQEWTEEYTKQALGNPSGSVIIDVLKSVNQYTVQLICMAVFGLNANTIKNPDSPFAKMANRFTEFSLPKIILFMLSLSFPKVFDFFGISIIDRQAKSFYETVLTQALKARLNGDTTRNDFLQLLVEAKRGELKAAGKDDLSDFEKDAQISGQGLQKKHYLTEETMTASCIEFFFAGYASTSSVITFTLYALALYPDVQSRLREEVDQIFKEDGTLDYDDVGHLVYMEMVVNEIMRKFPAVSRHERICTTDYKDPETGLKVPKDTMVGIPLNAIHNDKQYYDNPDDFDPEHFSPENKAKRTPYAFMPFGMGPRSCIGLRFALINSKSALAHMIHTFLIEPTEKTPVPLQGVSSGLNWAPPKNLEVKLTPIKNK